MRSIEMSARTVEDALEAACQALGVDRDDLNVSYEVLEFPARKLFKTIPAKVRVTVEEPETTAPVAEAPAAVETAAPVAEPADPVEAAPETPAEPPAEAPAAPAEEPAGDEEVALDIDADPRLQAAVDYLTPIFKLMGVEDFAFSALKKGEATILRVTGTHMGALIGRRGETMESLSYLASLVVNRMEGPYIKLGLDVGGYRGKREDDLAALARLLLRDGTHEPLRAAHHPHRRGGYRGCAQREQGRRPQPPRGDLFHRPQRQQPAGPRQRPQCPRRSPGRRTRKSP